MGSSSIQNLNINQASFKGADFAKFNTGIYPMQQSYASVSARPMRDNFYPEDSIATYAPPPLRKKEGSIQHIRNTISGFKKFGIRFGEYTWASIAGGIYGLIAGFMTKGLMCTINQCVKNKAGSLPTIAAKLTNPTSQTIGFFASLLTAVGLNLFNASQNVHQRTSAVDLRWNSGNKR